MAPNMAAGHRFGLLRPEWRGQYADIAAVGGQIALDVFIVQALKVFGQVGDGHPRQEVQKEGDVAELEVGVDDAHPLAGFWLRATARLAAMVVLPTPPLVEKR